MGIVAIRMGEVAIQVGKAAIWMGTVAIPGCDVPPWKCGALVPGRDAPIRIGAFPLGIGVLPTWTGMTPVE